MITTFQGEHLPPDMGRTTVPVPIIGQGVIEVGDELVVRGVRRAGAAGLIALMVLGVIAAMALAAFALSSAGWSGKALTRTVAFGGLALGFGGLTLIRKRQAARSSQPMELRVPWSQVKKADHEPDRAGVVLIHVKRSLLNTESLHFAPAEGPHGLVNALAERVAR